MKTIKEMDIFGDGMRIFLGYISRQLRKNPNYKPHPIIRAFECAIQGIEEAKEGESIMGVSGEGIKDSVYEPYIVVLQKQKHGIEVKEILNAKVGKRLPVDVMIAIFRLQIQLDKTDGDLIDPEEAVNALNNVIPGKRFYFLGDRWKEALEEFIKLIKEGKIHLPHDTDIPEQLKQIRTDTPWEDYPDNIRALIGSSIAQKFDSRGGIVVVTTPKKFKIEKYKVYDMATEFLMGKSAEYLRPIKRN